METIKKNLWVSSPEQVATFLAQGSDKIKLDYTRQCSESLDMSTEGWVKVGTVELCPTFNLGPEIIQMALEGADRQAEKLREDFQKKLAQIQDFKSTLLALPAPDQGELL